MELTKDEGNRPDTTLEGLAALKSAVPGMADASVTAGNSSQLSDGAAAVVVMDAALAQQRNFDAAGNLSRLRRCGLRARRDGHRAGLRRARSCSSSTV